MRAVKRFCAQRKRLDHIYYALNNLTFVAGGMGKTLGFSSIPMNMGSSVFGCFFLRFLAPSKTGGEATAEGVNKT